MYFRFQFTNFCDIPLNFSVTYLYIMMSLKKRLNIFRIDIILNTRYKRGIFLNPIQWIFSGIYYMINLIGNSLIRHIRYYREFNCSNFSKFPLKSGNIVCGECSITWLVECSLYLPQLRRLCVLGLFGFQWWWQRMVVYSFASVDRQPNKRWVTWHLLDASDSGGALQSGSAVDHADRPYRVEPTAN